MSKPVVVESLPHTFEALHITEADNSPHPCGVTLRILRGAGVGHTDEFYLSPQAARDLASVLEAAADDAETE